MHPSIAMLPTAEDAATAFAEVFYAIDYVYTTQGNKGLREIILGLKDGKQDKNAVEGATGMPFGLFEKSWLAHIKKQSFPKELLPREEVVLKENAKEKDEKKKGREISFGDFAEVTEVPARKFAHLGELMRERNRIKAAAEEYAKAHRLVGDKYESVSNKYALALLELRRLDEAEQVLRGSLRVHPGSSSTNVHLGRIYLFRKDYPKAKQSYMEALASDPFDPEIHLALMRIHGALGETALVARTKAASVVLTGLKAEDVDRVAREFLNQDSELVESEDFTQGKAAPSKDGGH
jgi:tetratricopeptide (TPR) repeat protein